MRPLLAIVGRASRAHRARARAERRGTRGLDARVAWLSPRYRAPALCSDHAGPERPRHGYPSWRGRSSRISCHDAFEPTKICAVGLSAGSSTNVPYGTPDVRAATNRPVQERQAVRAGEGLPRVGISDGQHRVRGGDQPDLVALYLAPGQERRPAHRAAVRAVAVERGDELICDLVRDGPAGTASPQHHLTVVPLPVVEPGSARPGRRFKDPVGERHRLRAPDVALLEGPSVIGLP